jgi:hypothetical protein
MLKLADGGMQRTEIARRVGVASVYRMLAEEKRLAGKRAPSPHRGSLPSSASLIGLPPDSYSTSPGSPRPITG